MSYVLLLHEGTASMFYLMTNVYHFLLLLHLCIHLSVLGQYNKQADKKWQIVSLYD